MHWVEEICHTWQPLYHHSDLDRICRKELPGRYPLPITVTKVADNTLGWETLLLESWYPQIQEQDLHWERWNIKTSIDRFLTCLCNWGPLRHSGQLSTHLTMDFIEGLPKSNGKEIILVVVERYTKYAHFIALSHPYSVHTVTQAFVDINVFKLHGPPVNIVTDRAKIFTSNMWQDIFKAMRIKLRLSIA